MSRYISQNELDKGCIQHDIHSDVFSDLEEQVLMNYYVIKHLILLKTRNMMDITVFLLQWFINVLIKSCHVVVIKANLCQIRITQTNS